MTEDMNRYLEKSLSKQVAEPKDSPAKERYNTALASMVNRIISGYNGNTVNFYREVLPKKPNKP